VKHIVLFKAQIDTAVKELLALKASFKQATGSDWNPNTSVPKPSVAAAAPPQEDAASLDLKIKEQGDKIRVLKEKKSAKVSLISFHTRLSLTSSF
jgi:bifunctional glutamyl/prolyl-tRNA synthetase